MTAQPIECQLSINHADVKFDIKNFTYKYGKSRFDGENIASVANAQVDDSDEAAIERFLSRRISSLLSKVAAYINTYDTQNNDSNEAVTTIVLSFPPTWQSKNLEKLQQSARDYVSNACIADFILLVNPNDAAVFQAKADEAADDLKYAITARIPGSLRLPINPVL